jgi:hypothetical protein
VEAPFLSEKAAVLLAMVARLRQTVVVAVLLLHRLSLGEVTRQEEATCQEVSKVARIVGCPRSTPFTRFYTAKGDTFVVVRLSGNKKKRRLLLALPHCHCLCVWPGIAPDIPLP